MLDYYDALNNLLKSVAPNLTFETLSLLNATNRILAQDLSAQYDLPMFDNSAMDGFAVAGALNASNFKINGTIIAGEIKHRISLQQGQAVRIFTGAQIPLNCDAVVMQENTKVDGDNLLITKPIIKGQNIRRQAEEIKQGDILLTKGQKITPDVIALLASQGFYQIPVFKKLKIMVFSTGNELINPNNNLKQGTIYDANRYLLVSFLQQNYEVIDGGILLDNLELTKKALLNAAEQADVIISSGGISVGGEDHVRFAIENCGTLKQWKLAIKPGKPFAWGEIGKSKVFMLPGNPVASLVTLNQLVNPALKILSGENIHNVSNFKIKARAKFSILKKQARREFMRVILHHDAQGNYVEKLDNQGSHMLTTCVKANALAEIAPNTLLNEGDLLNVYPLIYKT